MKLAHVVRFWTKVDSSGGPTECWPWQASRHRFGYGVVGVGSATDGTRGTDVAHRVAWQVTNGHIPAGACVLHRCDNPPCCNPAHLFLGTQRDNFAYMVSKGRVRRGERTGTAKLTEDDVVDIRSVYAFGGTQKDIASVYRIARQTVSRVVLRQTWRHLP